jgi:hypothetical protein
MPGVPPNTIRANIRASLAGAEEMVHTLHFERVNTATTDQPTLQAIANKIVEEWTEVIFVGTTGSTSLANVLKSTVVYTTVDVYALSAAGLAEEQAQATFGTTAKGIGTSSALPPEVALTVSLRTGLPGRRMRGRLYLGGFTTSALGDTGIATTAVQQQVAQALQRFGTDMKMQTATSVDTLNWVVLSRAATATTAITQVRVGSLFDVQRRRQHSLSETFDSRTITY